MTKQFLMAAAAVLGLAAPSLAQAETGFYGKLSLGGTSLENMNFSEGTTANLNLDPDVGISLTGAVGYRLAQPLRVEVQLGYGRNSLDGTFQQNVQVLVPCGTIAGQPCLAPNVDGNVDSFSGFAMGYYHFPQIGALKPYAGIGVGFVDVDLDVGAAATMNDGTRSRFAIIDGSDTVVGYRGTVGVAYDVGLVDLTLGYTYTFTDRISLPGRGPNVGFTFDKRLNAHTINAGVVYNF
jgi:opacity protein-like surface antigen